MGLIDDIRKALTADGRNSQEIGTLADIHPVNLRHFKSGSRGLALDALDRLAKVLGIQITVKKTARKK